MAPPPSDRLLEDDELVELTLPSGAPWEVDPADQNYVIDLVQTYTKEFEFVSVSDLQDLDRVIIYESLIYSWSRDLSRGSRRGRPVDEIELRKRIKEISAELRQLKKSLGIDKVARERARGEGSVPAYLNNLRERALHFGINRSQMSAKAIELAMQEIALVTLHDNCTETERREQHVEAEDILDWIRTVFTPEFTEIDEHFRANEQRYWVIDQ